MQLSTSLKMQQGLSLIEILVALAISSFILLGLSQLFIQSNQSYFTLDSGTEVQENARFALEISAKAAQNAGYRPLPGGAASMQDHSVLYPAAGVFATAGQVVFGENDSDGSMVAPNGDTVKEDTDYFTIRGIGDEYDETSDCTGQTVADFTGYTLTFYVNTDNELICDVDGTQNIMVDNIASMQILYGVETTTDAGCAGTCLRYINADVFAANAAMSWENVVSIKVGLLAMSSRSIFPDALATPIQVLDAAYTLPPDDQRKSTQLYSETILLRNVRK